jgi:hypothetical protein
MWLRHLAGVAKISPIPRGDVAHTRKKAQPLNEMLVMTKRNVAQAKQDAAHVYEGRYCQIHKRMLPILNMGCCMVAARLEGYILIGSTNQA